MTERYLVGHTYGRPTDGASGFTWKVLDGDKTLFETEPHGYVPVIARKKGRVVSTMVSRLIGPYNNGSHPFTQELEPNLPKGWDARPETTAEGTFVVLPVSEMPIGVREIVERWVDGYRGIVAQKQEASATV